ncbi:MOFRL family protein, partial [Haladaptatus sp. W1]|uniref:MOFRL family protein n=1 Tax=Haladaptatus sp. W1 TaxID=1897478 RepID=UPI000A6A9E15
MTHNHTKPPSPRTVAFDCLHAGIDAAQPGEVVRRTLSRDGSMLTVAGETFDLDDFSRVVVLGGGNAAGEMAASLESVLGEHLTHGIVVTDTPAEPDEADAFERVTNHVIADNWTALDAAANQAGEHGYTPLVLSSRIGGEASDVGRTHAAIGVECLATGNPLDPPAVLLSGGETTVTVDGDGVGGPNQEFALAATREIDRPGIVVAGIDTDSLDGSTDAAGALVDYETISPEQQAAARAALR